MTPEEKARFMLQHGTMFPYEIDTDTSDDGAGHFTNHPVDDWAHAAARGVLADLSDRRGVKQELERVDYKVRQVIVQALAEIIRQSRHFVPEARPYP